MRSLLKYFYTIVFVVLGIIFGTLIRFNIENWAAQNGLDNVFSEGLRMISSSFWMQASLLGMVFFAGASAALWLDAFIRRRFLHRFHLKKRKVVEGVSFRHETVNIDGKTFKNCKFTGVTFEYNGEGIYDFIGCEFDGPFTIKVNNPIAAGGVGLARLMNEAGIRLTQDEGSQPLRPPGTVAEKQP